MTASTLPDNPVECIRQNLVALRMSRALEALDAVVQQLERGTITPVEAIDTLLAEEITVREGRRIKAALQMARLATIKTLTGFDFSFQPSPDRNRIMALASLDFIDKHEVVHLFSRRAAGQVMDAGSCQATCSMKWTSSLRPETGRHGFFQHLRPMRW